MWTEIAGAVVLYDGPLSPITQTFGVGVHQPVSPAEMDEIETFFRSRGATVQHEVSPMVEDSTVALLTGRGYRPIEFTSVMFRDIAPGLRLTRAPNERVSVRTVAPGDAETYIATATAGWSEYLEFADMMAELSRVALEKTNGALFLAEVDGRAIATGALNVVGGVGLMAGASTVPEARNQGAQLALLEHRLRHAAAEGCDLAMMCARPGSASQRNAERHGFRIAYTRVKWALPPNA